jgi:hypothetical protein
MIGTLPVVALAPLDYRYALDAAMAVLAHAEAPLVVCDAAELVGEVHQRVPHRAKIRPASAALWVEPLADTWQAELITLTDSLTSAATLAIVASRPLARILPERRAWGVQPLGLQLGGLGGLRRALSPAGFTLVESHGIHSVYAIGLNLLSRWMEHRGRADLGDRLHAAARLRYCTAGRLATLSTVALLIARKDRA